MLYIPRILRRCTQCDELKPETQRHFFRRKNPRNGYGIKAECKCCHSERMRRRRNSDPEREKERDRSEWLSCDRPREKARLREFYARNRKRINAKHQQYRREHPNINRAAKHRRRALEFAAEGIHDPDDIQHQYRAQKGKCYWCGKRVGKT